MDMAFLRIWFVFLFSEKRAFHLDLDGSFRDLDIKTGLSLRVSDLKKES
jgi:hypothetical protein